MGEGILLAACVEQVVLDTRFPPVATREEEEEEDVPTPADAITPLVSHISLSSVRLLSFLSSSPFSCVGRRRRRFSCDTPPPVA